MVGIKDFEMPSCCNSCSHWSFNRDDEPLCDLTYEYISQFDKRQADCPLVEAIPKDRYEARLKSDLVAMLEEIKNQINDYMNRKWETLTDADKAGCPTLDDWKYHMAEATEDFIDERINELKED